MPVLSFECRPARPEESAAAASRLLAYTDERLGEKVTPVPFGLFADLDGVTIASVIGKIFFAWLHLDTVWVEPERRGQGVGRLLLTRTEAQARARKLEGIEVWTQSWQAPGFYRAMGYEELAVIPDFRVGEHRYVLRRHLRAEVS